MAEVGGETGDEMVTIRARHKKTGEVTIMRVKKGTPMGEVFKQYAEKKGLEERSLSFVAGGKSIPTNAKPMDLKRAQTESRVSDAAPPTAGTTADNQTGLNEEDLGCSCFG
ncbi:hypothetical protein M885DRAFT_509777 [Pelagophyceae sp. CCMP2097]|nr:hypothetical protein M885DRAFT_509777 [Pelagophyceae sp. CCMP2097]